MRSNEQKYWEANIKPEKYDGRCTQKEWRNALLFVPVRILKQAAETKIRRAFGAHK